MHKCFKCDKMAVWYYMPYSESKIDENCYYCDTCVSRGCSCNIINYSEDIERDNYEYYKDEFGRDLPCVEYIYSKAGFNEDTTNK